LKAEPEEKMMGEEGGKTKRYGEGGLMGVERMGEGWLCIRQETGEPLDGNKTTRWKKSA